MYYILCKSISQFVEQKYKIFFSPILSTFSRVFFAEERFPIPLNYFFFTADPHFTHFICAFHIFYCWQSKRIFAQNKIQNRISPKFLMAVNRNNFCILFVHNKKKENQRNFIAPFSSFLRSFAFFPFYGPLAFNFLRFEGLWNFGYLFCQF